MSTVLDQISWIVEYSLYEITSYFFDDYFRPFTALLFCLIFLVPAFCFVLKKVF